MALISFYPSHNYDNTYSCENLQLTLPLHCWTSLKIGTALTVTTALEKETEKSFTGLNSGNKNSPATAYGSCEPRSAAIIRHM